MVIHGKFSVTIRVWIRNDFLEKICNLVGSSVKVCFNVVAMRDWRI